MRNAALLTGALLVLVGCTTGEGEGSVTSDRLYVEDCWEGAFDLRPTFFGANAFDAGHRTELFLRVQRGDNTEEVSDGVLIVVKNTEAIREAAPSSSFRLGLPAGVAPPGMPLVADPDAPQISLALYLMDSCQAQNAVLYSVDGTIRFDSIFSGDVNESSAEDRLTAAEFEAKVTDPRYQRADGTYPDGVVSELSGRFQFYFQRGQPAQPFP